jgi:hypothetical protein
MLIQQLIEAIQLNEAREAPLYHFTSEAGFFNIIRSDTLVSGGAKIRSGGIDPEGRIYFTRDYGRQFLPANILAGSWGFRVNQDLLRQRYGKKLVAGGQGKHSPWDEQKRQAWLADPKNAGEIARVKSGASGSTSRQDGADTKDIVKGTIGQSQRWESEEQLNVGAVPDFHEYVTGLVYAGGSKTDPHRTVVGGKKVDFKSRGTNVDAGLDQLAQLLMGHFTGQAGWAQRDALIEYMTRFDIPFVYQRQDYPAKQVKDRMIAIWRERKAEKERRSNEVSKTFTVMANPQGGGIAVSAPDMQTAVDRALKEFPHKFPNGVFGVEDVGTQQVQMFAQPKKTVGQTPAQA